MKRTFLAVLGTLLLGACTNDDTPNVSEEVNEGGNRYLAVSLVANAQTRADDTSGFTNGDATEYAVADVSKVEFFFFDASGNPFEVTSENKNYVQAQTLTWGNANTDGTNVTISSEAIAVLEAKKGTIPSQMVVVVNCPFTPSSNISLSDLRKKELTSGLLSYPNDGETSATDYFVMSNAAYNDGSRYVYSTPLSMADLGVTAVEASQKAVEVYVERVVGKVTMDKPSGAFTVKDPSDKNKNLSITITGVDGEFTVNGKAANTWTLTPSVKVEGWQLFNTATKTYLQKNIDNYTNTDWAWTDATNYRSYWSVVPTDLAYDTPTLSWSQMSTNIPNSTNNPAVYPFENTLADATDTSGDVSTTVDNHTSVAIATTLIDDDTNTMPTFGLWLSNYYSLKKLKALIAEYLSKSLGTKSDDEEFVSITADDIDFKVEDNGYQEIPVIASTSSSNTWVNAKLETLDSDAVDKILNTVPKAQIWKDGKSYYFTTIKHKQGTTEVSALVRNHWYTVTVNSIAGLGTPVYDAEQSVDPVKPSETDTWYLDAKINIQAWNKVSNSVDLD
jgi:hypothetical protein